MRSPLKRNLLTAAWLLWSACSGAPSGIVGPAAESLVWSSDVPTPWTVRVGETTTVHIRVRDAQGAEVPLVHLEAGSIALDGKVEVTRSGVSDFTVSLTPRLPAMQKAGFPGGYQEINGTLEVWDGGRTYNTSAAPLPIGYLVVFGGPPAAVYAVTNEAAMVAGEKREFAALAATGFHDDTSNTDREARSHVSPTWTTDNAGVVAITPSGLAEARAPGTAHLTATAGGFTDRVTVTVTEGTVAPPGNLELDVRRENGTTGIWPWWQGWFFPDPLDQTDHSQQDENLGMVAFDSHGNVVAVGAVNRNREEKAWDGGEILLGTWTGSGLGFAYVQEPFETARVAKVAVDVDDRAWVLYLGNEAGLRLADRPVHGLGEPFRHRTLDWTHAANGTLNRHTLRRLESPQVNPRGAVMMPHPGGGVFVAAVMAWRDPVMDDDGCLELVRMWAVHDDKVEVTDVRSVHSFFDPYTEKCVNRSEALSGSGPLVQLLPVLPGEQWPRVVYLPPIRHDNDVDDVPFLEKSKGYVELIPGSSAWTAREILPDGLTATSSTPLVFMPFARVVPQDQPTDDVVMLGMATTGHTFTVNSNLTPFALVRDASGNWHVLRDTHEQRMVVHNDGPLHAVMADSGGVLSNDFIWPMAEGQNAAGWVNGRLWTANWSRTDASVIDGAGGLRNAVINDVRGRRPDDFFSPLSKTVWGSGHGRIVTLGPGDSPSPPQRGTHLSVVLQPRPTPRFSGNFATGQRIGDGSSPELPLGSPAVDADGRIWIASSPYGFAEGGWLVSDTAQTHFERLPSTALISLAGFHGPMAMDGRVVQTDSDGHFNVASSLLGSQGPGSMDLVRAIAGELPFHPSTELLLPGGAYFAVSASENFDGLFHRRFCANLLGAGSFTDLSDPDAVPGEVTRMDRESARLLRDEDQALLLSLVNTLREGGTMQARLETFDASGQRLSRRFAEWGDASELVATTAAVLDASTLVAMSRNLSVPSVRVSRIDRATLQHVSVDIGTMTGRQPSRPLLVLPGGTVVAGWEEPTAFGSRVVIRASHDGGHTWGETVPVWPGGGGHQVLMHLVPKKDGQVLVILADRGVLSQDIGRMAPYPQVNEFAAFAADAIAISAPVP